MEENKKEQTVFDGGVTEEKVAQWKKQHRKVARIDVVDDDELHVGYFKRPDLTTMSAVAKLAKTDEVRSGQALFDGCWLGGSELLRQDSVLFISAMQQLNQLMSEKAASLKNL